MNHGNLGNVNIRRNALILKIPIVSMLSLKELEQIPSSKSKYLCLYKRFYRLRNMVGQKSYHSKIYCSLLRLRFSREDFNKRRECFVGLQDKLSEKEIYERLINTVAFVFNSTLYPEQLEQKDPSPPFYYQDTKMPLPIEGQIVSTILRMENQKPDKIKYDRHYQWVTTLNLALSDISDTLGKKSLSRLFKEVDANYIGFRDYEETLMLLNETYKLCL